MSIERTYCPKGYYDKLMMKLVEAQQKLFMFERHEHNKILCKLQDDMTHDELLEIAGETLEGLLFHLLRMMDIDIDKMFDEHDMMRDPTEFISINWDAFNHTILTCYRETIEDERV